ncbi:MAG TPA: polysaccharide pyruvyl transferase family protein [Kofleriaceae bacterium]|nr:polysaccharide pyruvyl transferase family protein [Kofleriaceae bacterium]
MTPETVLITRIRTNNKGNQALSSAWAAMLQQAFPTGAVRAMERRPPHFLQYTLEQLAGERDPFRAFDQITSKLARLAPGPAYIAAAKGAPRIQLDETIAQPRGGIAHEAITTLRQRLNLRRWAAFAGRYRDDYKKRLAAVQRAQLVVVNPAGEFFHEDPTPAFYHLLDAYVAHKLGRPTAIVNHTMDINDPTLRKLIPRIYRELALVGFRDEKSVGAFKAMGGTLDNVLVTPDLALMTRHPDKRAPAKGRVAVAVHAPAAQWAERGAPWLDVITGLQTLGLEVVLVSNEMPADHAFFSSIRSRVTVPVEGAGLDFDRYSELLGGFDFVVSSRMHTSILAMVAGTPVIPVEGPSFKISGLFAELGFARPVIQSTQPGWTDQVIAAAAAMRDQRDASASDTVAKISAARDRITSVLVPRLQQAVAR